MFLTVDVVLVRVAQEVVATGLALTDFQGKLVVRVQVVYARGTMGAYVWSCRIFGHRISTSSSVSVMPSASSISLRVQPSSIMRASRR